VGIEGGSAQHKFFVWPSGFGPSGISISDSGDPQISDNAKEASNCLIVNFKSHSTGKDFRRRAPQSSSIRPRRSCQVSGAAASGATNLNSLFHILCAYSYRISSYQLRFSIQSNGMWID
jgi:hypothetical protein